MMVLRFVAGTWMGRGPGRDVAVERMMGRPGVLDMGYI